MYRRKISAIGRKDSTRASLTNVNRINSLAKTRFHFMSAQANKDITTIAVSKGRIFDECSELLKKIGITVAQKDLDGRKLVLPTNKSNACNSCLHQQMRQMWLSHRADRGIA